ncbi:MAG TPA: hypothetical protein VFH78_06970 [Candidatus Thermoplasmatota archaeon]|nr:hypothetical protein [Candidatus Thermoplasmatota archaeon]
MKAATREGNHKLRAPEDVIALALRVATALTHADAKKERSRRPVSAGHALRLLLALDRRLPPPAGRVDRERLAELPAILAALEAAP